jgi:putative ABC transport system permease protein
MHSLSLACRSLIRRPAFLGGALLTFALGIAATTAMFSVVDAVLLKPLPFPDADRLVTVMEANPARTARLSLIAPGRLEEWHRLNKTFEALSASYNENLTDTSGAEPERLEGRRVAPRFFRVFGMAPLAGRVFADDEEREGGPLSAVISEGLWARRYARRTDAVGKRLVLGGAGYTIVGVIPATFAAGSIDVWLPAQTSAFLVRIREARFMSGVGRMKPGVTIAQAAADLARIQQTLGEQFPATDRGWSASVADLKQGRIGDYQRALWLVFGAVALLFAIAVANIAGLMLVQLRRRAHEFAIRRAVGGSRAQIVGAVMREVAVIATLGSIAGIAAAVALVRLFATTFATVPRMNELTLDVRSLAFTAGASIVAAAAFGLWPTLHATRGELTPVLAQTGRGVSAVRHRLQRLLVISQIALSVVLAGSAGLLLTSYGNLARLDLGFDPSHAIAFHVGAAWDENRPRVGQMQERLVAEIEQLPDVVTAGITNFLPATGATLRYQVELEGLATSEDRGKITVGARTIGGNYLKALGATLVAGNWCPPLRMDFRAQPKAMVNRAFADRYGPNLLGRHLTFDQSNLPYEIVGIVGDVAEDSPGAAPVPYMYACQSAGAWPDPEYVVRTRGDSRALMSAVRDIVHRVDPTRAIFGVKPVERVIDSALDQPRLNASLLSLFAGAAIALASLGLHSLLMLLVSERTREMGVRMAIGATPAQVVGLVLAGAGRLLLAGVGAGLAMSIAAGRALRAVLFGISPFDVRTLGAAVIVLGGVTLMAAALPARRAASIDPIEAIRSE